MKKKKLIHASLVLLGSLLLISETSVAMIDSTGDLASINKNQPIESIIVKFNENSSLKSATDQDLINHLSKKLQMNFKSIKKLNNGAYLLKINQPEMGVLSLDYNTAVESKLNLLSSDSNIQYAETNGYVYMQKTPNDSRYAEQWHYFDDAGGMNLPEAWDITTGNDIAVGVIDTGIVQHEELKNKILPGRNFVDDDNAEDDPTDHGGETSYHGSHVAGTIAAETDNNGIIAGVSWGAKIVPVRVLGDDGRGSFATIMEGMRWAAGLTSSDNVDESAKNPNPVKILNLSLGGLGLCPKVLQETINELDAAGVSIIVAAGNSALPAKLFTPANCKKVITVGATSKKGSKSFYTNFGKNVLDIAAPGGDKKADGEAGGILSLGAPGKYQFLQGTSMATPHVAGVVSLMHSLKPDISYKEVLDYIKRGAKGDVLGVGLIDANKTLNLLKKDLEHSDKLVINEA